MTRTLIATTAWWLATGLYTMAPAVPVAEDPIAESGAAEPATAEEAVLVREVGASTLALRVGVGEVSYEEHVSLDPIDSSFDAPTVTLAGEWHYVHPRGYRTKVQFGGWLSDEDTETWREAGDLIQRNSLEVLDVELRGHWGLDLLRNTPARTTAWIGLGMRSTSFERSEFEVIGRDLQEDFGTVDEDFLVVYVDGRLDGAWPITEAVSVFGGVGVGFVFVNEADNDLLGTIGGDGGERLEVDGGVQWAYAAGKQLALAVRYDAQSLDGEQVQQLFLTPEGISGGVVEWPDNDLDIVRLDVTWSIEL